MHPKDLYFFIIDDAAYILIFCLNVVVVCTCVSSTDVFLWGSSWSGTTTTSR
jgi:hypothetical protein